MSNDVFANGREISCKKADGKTICAFPDVCMTPPVTAVSPSGIPIPYPNTGFAKDTFKGSRTVKITSKEIIKKNVSYYKTSYCDEAGCATPAKKGIITGTIKGKVYFKSWSMDVRVEGKNVVRHLDMTTHNHKSEIGNESIPWPHIDTMNVSPDTKVKVEPSKVCDCCNGTAHSQAQAKGESITEEQFYGPTETGLRRSTGKGGIEVHKPRSLTKKEKEQVEDALAALELTREECKDQVPPNPPGDDACNKYYRSTAQESQDARELYDSLNNSSNPERPEGWAEAKMIAHRVPLNGGGCPIGSGNTQIVNDSDCSDWDKRFGVHQSNVALIGRNKL